MRVLIPLMAVVACTPDTKDPGGQFGEENGWGCVVDTETAMDWDELSDNGFTPDDLVAALGTEFVQTLTWADDSTSELTVTIADAASPRYVTWKQESDGAEIDLGCDPTVAVDVTMGFATDDGAFAESWTRTVHAYDLGEIDHFVSLDTVDGTFDPETWADDEYEEIWAHLDITWKGGELGGEISGTGQQTHGDPDDPDTAVSATFFPIATFGVEIDE